MKKTKEDTGSTTNPGSNLARLRWKKQTPEARTAAMRELAKKRWGDKGDKAKKA